MVSNIGHGLAATIAGLFFIGLTVSPAWAVPKGASSCSGVILNKATGDYEELGSNYYCFNSAKEADNAFYMQSNICLGGAMAKADYIYLSGASDTEVVS